MCFNSGKRRKKGKEQIARRKGEKPRGELCESPWGGGEEHHLFEVPGKVYPSVRQPGPKRGDFSRTKRSR